MSDTTISVPGSTFDANVITKNAFVLITKLIPGVGPVVSGLLSVLWPTSKKVDVWQLVASQVGIAIDAKVLDFELQERRNELDSLGRNLVHFSRARANKEKGNFLSILINECNNLQRKLTKSKNAIHLTPFVSPLALIHCSLLKTRLENGKSLYGENDDDAWLEDLVTTINEYKQHIQTNHAEWMKWREKQIQFSEDSNWGLPGTNYFLDANDTLANEALRYSADGASKANCERLRKTGTALMLSLARCRFLAYCSPIYHLDRLIPGKEQVPTDIDRSLRILRFGPITALTVPNQGAKRYNFIPQVVGGGEGINFIGKPVGHHGNIKTITVREYNVIDHLEVEFEDGRTISAGNPKGGAAHIVKCETPVTGVELHYHAMMLLAVRFFFADGKMTPVFGNRAKHGTVVRTAGNIPDFRLTALTMQTGRVFGGPFRGGTGVAELDMEFRHNSLPAESLL